MDLEKKHKNLGICRKKCVCVCVFFMVDEGVPGVFHRIPARYHAFRGLALRSAQKMWKTLFAGSSPPAEGPETETHRGGSGLGNFPLKKTVGGSLKKPSRKTNISRPWEKEKHRLKNDFWWDMLVSSQES